MKKFFAWVMVLAMVMTMMPVMDVHQHAHAEELACSQCAAKGKSCDAPWGFVGSLCSKCYHAKDDHKPVSDAHTCEYKETFRKDATCVEEGYQKMECECGSRMTPWPTIAINPNAHNLVNNKCTNVNSETGVSCNYHVCTWSANGGGKCQTVDGCTATHAHTDDNFRVESTTAGTCVTPGTSTEKCEVCGASRTRTGDTDPNNHSWDNGICANGCGAGCPSHSYENGKCPVCKAACTHAGESYTVTSETAATCVKEGSQAVVYACGGTGTIATPVNPDAHTWSNGYCINSGCGQACDHVWSSGTCTKCAYDCQHPETTQTTVTAPTCKNEGSANVTCNECGELVDTVVVPVDEDAHKWTDMGIGRVCGLCSKMEYTGGNKDEEDKPIDNPCDEHEWVSLSFGVWYCYKCGAHSSDVKPMEPEACDHADTYTITTKAATCKATGTAQEICDICEEVVNDNVELPIDPNAHDWVEFSFGAGYCKLCNYISVDDDLFHDHDKDEETCDHDWAQVTHNGYVCTKCGAMTVDESVVNPPVVEPTAEPEPCEHDWVVYSFGGWYCKKCGKITVDNPTDDPDPVPNPDLPEADEDCPHKWKQFSPSGWVCELCGGVITKDPTEKPVEPTDPPVEPTDPPVEPTDPPVEPTDPPVEPTDPPVEPTDPPVEPTDPPVEPTDPPVEPTDPPVEPTEPPVEPTEKPADPTEKPADPTEKPAEPTEKPADPTEKPADPTEKPADPTEKPAEPTKKPQTSNTSSASNRAYNRALSMFGPKANEIGGNGYERVALVSTENATTKIDVIAAVDYAVAQLEVVMADGKMTAKMLPVSKSVTMNNLEIVVYTSIEAYNAGEGIVLTDEGIDVTGAPFVIIDVNGTANFKLTDDNIEIISYMGPALEAMLALVK